jgi:predicted N-formylglutamate amidohydrolase
MPEPITRLLEADEPEPVEILRAHGSSDFFFTADHAGRHIPRRLGRLGLTEAELSRHIAWDIGIMGVARLLSATLDATAVLQRYSRLVIDCNRDPAVASSIPEVSEHTIIPGNRGLSAAEAASRRAAVFDPYHWVIADLLDSRQRQGRRTVLVALHSFTPVFKGEARPMHVGILYNRDDRLARILLDLLSRDAELVVGDNAPYRVSDITDYGIPVHGERRGLPHVEVEIRQDLIETETGQGEWSARLAGALLAADAQMKETAC